MAVVAVPTLTCRRLVGSCSSNQAAKPIRLSHSRHDPQVIEPFIDVALCCLHFSSFIHDGLYAITFPEAVRSGALRGAARPGAMTCLQEMTAGLGDRIEPAEANPWRVLRLRSTKRRMLMTRPAKDAAREERIAMEIIVDAYGPEEQALGCDYY